MNLSGKNRVVVIGAVVTLVGLIVVLIVGLAATHSLDDNSTPLVTAILGLVVTTIPGLMALNSAEGAKQATKDVHTETVQLRHDMSNGVLKSKVKEALEESNLVPPKDGNSNG